MEKVDIYDQEGWPTGQVKTKDAAHSDGSWHRAIHVWIVNSNGQLLIQRRALQKEVNPNKWGVSSVGGHISAGETAINTAIRETQEEINLAIQESELEFLFTTPHQKILNDGTYIGNHFNDSFLVEKDIDLSLLKLQPEEVSEVKIIHFTELEKQITEKHPELAQHPEYEKLFPILHQRHDTNWLYGPLQQ